MATLLAGCGGAESDDSTDAAAASPTDRAYAFMQGNIVGTENSLDVAISGRGMFVFRDAGGGELYGRHGAFKFNYLGFIVGPTGARLLGQVWNESEGRAEGELEPVQMQLPNGGYPVATGQGPVKAARGVQIGLSFDAQAKIIPAMVPAIRFDDPGTYNFSTEQTLYDGQGSALRMTYYFQKVGVNRWRIFAAINGVPLNQPNGVEYDSTRDDPSPIFALEFGPDGRLVRGSSTLAVVTVNDPRVPPPSPVVYPALPIRLLEPTQFAADFGIWMLEQDGFSWGQLSGLSFDAQGFVIAAYSNGRWQRIYRLALAQFAQPAALAYAGARLWAGTSEAGAKTLLAPGVGSAGVLVPGALELPYGVTPQTTCNFPNPVTGRCG